MIDFIVKLETALQTSGIDYEIQYHPETKTYTLEIDNDVVMLTPVYVKGDKR